MVTLSTTLEEQEKTFKANCKVMRRCSVADPVFIVAQTEMNEWKEKTAVFQVGGVVADDEHTLVLFSLLVCCII